MRTASGASDEDRNRELLMRALDGEISDAEKMEFEELLDNDAELRGEWQSLRRVREQTAKLELAKPPDDLWEEFMDSVYRRVERGISWILLSIGAVVLISYGLWELVNEVLDDVTIPWYVKGGALALIVGLVILAISVVREKYFVFKNDPYRDVQR